MKSPRQINVGSWWGKLVLSASQIGIIISVVTMFLAGIGAFSEVREWALRALNWDLHLWQFGGLVLGVIVLGLAGAYVFGMASYMGEWSRQWWAHDNPMRKEMREMEQRITEKIERGGKGLPSK